MKQQLKELRDKLDEIIKQSEQPELVSGEWYIGNEEHFGDWLFKYSGHEKNLFQGSISYSLCDMAKYTSGQNYYNSTRPLTPEERVKYAKWIGEEWPNPERVKGRWYAIKPNALGILPAFVNYRGGNVKCFGFDLGGHWCDEGHKTTGFNSGDNWSQWRYATESEVKKMLVKEAVKRYPIGCTVESIYRTVCKVENHSFTYNGENLYIKNGHCKVFDLHTASWAEIVKPAESPIMIGSYVVRIEGNTAIINDHSYTRAMIKKLQEVACYDKVNVSIMGVQVAKETLEGIINRLDK